VVAPENAAAGVLGLQKKIARFGIVAFRGQQFAQALHGG
jgi:hypothetical protein